MNGLWLTYRLFSDIGPSTPQAEQPRTTSAPRPRWKTARSRGTSDAGGGNGIAVDEGAHANHFKKAGHDVLNEASMTTLLERARELQARGIFLGGPPSRFEIAGRKLLMTLLSEGLVPSSRVLDIGCGCLRGGYWLIHFLDEGRYFGIEPNTTMVEAGMSVLLEPGLKESKRPGSITTIDGTSRGSVRRSTISPHARYGRMLPSGKSRPCSTAS